MGKPFGFHTKPLDGYFQHIRWWPRFRRGGGYAARWEVFGERLFLTGLFGIGWIVPRRLLGKLPPDPDPFEPEQDGAKTLRLPDLFPHQAPLVFAEWVTQRLVVPIGPRRVYVRAGFGYLHDTYRTLEVAEGCARSVRDWDALEWARETGQDWLLDELAKGPPALDLPARNAERDEVEAEEDLGYWRDLNDPIERMLSYERAQIDALRKPCGKTPVD
jgi:hypothetical protein